MPEIQSECIIYQVRQNRCNTRQVKDNFAVYGKITNRPDTKTGK